MLNLHKGLSVTKLLSTVTVFNKNLTPIQIKPRYKAALTNKVILRRSKTVQKIIKLYTYKLFIVSAIRLRSLWNKHILLGFL